MFAKLLNNSIFSSDLKSSLVNKCKYFSELL